MSSVKKFPACCGTRDRIRMAGRILWSFPICMKDDMTAFIEGLGMRRFFGYVECEEVPSVLWDSGQNPDGWKDFVELSDLHERRYDSLHRRLGHAPLFRLCRV